MVRPFTIKVSGPDLKTAKQLVSQRDFVLDDLALANRHRVSMTNRMRDFLRIAMVVYVTDRLIKRSGRPSAPVPSRTLEIEIEVAEPDFWAAPETVALLTASLESLSNDNWSFGFRAGETTHLQQHFCTEEVGVGLYSGGLDSYAGAAHFLNNSRMPLVAVHAAHQFTRGPVRGQLAALGRHFGNPVETVRCRTRLVGAPRFNKQESTQRLRSFLFTALGAVVATGRGARLVHVFESGVGSYNVPPQFGMQFGALATRGCHPRFLKCMSQLATHVSNKPFQFNLPLLRATKGEAAFILRRADLAAVAQHTFSCVHFPLRILGTAKQCGLCFGCLGRRQALWVAGVEDPASQYVTDLFAMQTLDAIDPLHLNPLKACLKQMCDMSSLIDNGPAPAVFWPHVLEANDPSIGMLDDDIVFLHRRYTLEWFRMVTEGQRRGLAWAKWIRTLPLAA
mgnify:CR=1 FL=1